MCSSGFVHEFFLPVVETSAESGSRHYRLLLATPDPLHAADNFFPPVPPPPPAATLSPSPPPTLLCQHLEDFFDKSSAHTSSPPSFHNRQCPLAVRFKEIDSSSLYDVLSSRVNSSEILVLVETGRRTSDDFYLCCFPHVTPRGPRDRGPRVIPGSRTPRAASFRDKGPLG